MVRHNDVGVVHILEAALASVLIVTTLFYVNSQAMGPVDDREIALRAMSSDMLNVLEYRANSPEHPSLGFALSSAAQWDESSHPLNEDIGRMLPDGTYYYMETPYGDIGRRPADLAKMCLTPFVAYGSPGKMLDCKLILWRA